jgi:hypothetical protein
MRLFRCVRKFGGRPPQKTKNFRREMDLSGSFRDVKGADNCQNIREIAEE